MQLADGKSIEAAVGAERHWRRGCRFAASSLVASCVVALLLAGCGGPSSQSPPPPAVDLQGQAEPASEMVDAALLARHTEGVLAAREPARYLAAELWRIGLVPGGAKGGWQQPFEGRRRVARPAGAWVLVRGGGRATLGSRDLVAALGGRWARVRLRGLPAVFVAPTLAAPAGALAAKVVVVLDPAAPVQPGAPAPLPDLLRRAAAARAHAVLVLPRPGTASALPPPSRAAELAAGTGVPLVAWLDEVAARALVRIGLDLPLEALPRLEWRADLLPLSLGTLHGGAAGDVEREPHRNLVALLPGRAAGAETVAVLAPLPGSRRRGAAASGDSRVGNPRVADPRAEAAAAAELLAVATAFQALSDPPRRTVVFGFTDPGEDGLAGARQLAADPRWRPPRLAAALVLAGGSSGPPTQDVTFVGARASPLYGLTARLAALQGRRVSGEPAPARGALWHSPAWALIQAGVPTALLAAGVVPRSAPAPAEFGAVVPVAAVAAQPLSGAVEDARLGFRLALELAEGGRPPRVDPAQVEAVLRRAEALPAVTPATRPLLRRVPSPAAPAADATGASPPALSEGETPDAGAAAHAPLLSNVPEFVAPPPAGGAEAPAAPDSPPPPVPRDERPRGPTPSPTPPQRRG